MVSAVEFAISHTVLRTAAWRWLVQRSSLRVSDGQASHVAGFRPQLFEGVQCLGVGAIEAKQRAFGQFVRVTQRSFNRQFDAADVQRDAARRELSAQESKGFDTGHVDAVDGLSKQAYMLHIGMLTQVARDGAL